MALTKTLIDSDVCLDSIMGRKPYHKEADKLFLEAENSNISAVISADSFSNIFYILKKISTAQRAISQLKKLRTITSVGIMQESIIDAALSSGWSDFEDALQHFCAIEEDCEVIVTRNISDFSKSALPVYTPSQFLDTEELNE